MLYLLDANVLITAHNTYYPIARIPEFWNWLRFQGESNLVKIPQEIIDEVEQDEDQLVQWFKKRENREALVFHEEADPIYVQKVLDKGYANDLSDYEIEAVGRDPFLVSCAFANREDRCVVTLEQSKLSKQRHNRKIPDVCHDMGVQCFDTFQMNRALDFTTNWANMV